MQAIKRIDGLDALRGYAAITIAIFHTVVLRKLFSYQELPDFFRYLYLAVPLFFAISSFSLCVGYYGACGTADDVWRFFRRRFLRIAPLFYLMILVWTISRRSLPEVSDVLLNISFLFNVIPGEHNSMVHAGWSIGVEMIFYAMFPFLLLGMRTIRSSALYFIISFGVAILAGVLIVSAKIPGSYDWMNAFVQLPFFVGGVLLYHIHKMESERTDTQKKLTSFAILASSLFIITIFGNLQISSLNIFGWSFGRHLICVPLMLIVLALAIYPFRILVNRFSVYLGAISYGVYLIHPWAIWATGKYLQPKISAYDFHPAITALLMTGTVLAITCMLATATYYCLERPIVRFKRERNAVPATA